ncbi:MarC family protein [Luteitalea sp.]|jgi:multiple antibiotic resistance protein|uniref:MarC family protein n=1 Tax=Luteitalea sp. TaxID=2004800 RepID=UPI000ABDFA4B|nr:MarC family protein [Luteitalea sp.]
MDVFSAIVTLFLVMDPLGNVPLFLSVLKTVPPERRQRVLLRELGFAYVVLVAFLLMGNALLRFLGLEQEAVSIAGGIVLFLIALRMIFPDHGTLTDGAPEGEPFVVPLAIPLIAGPSTLATLLLLDRAVPSSTMTLLLVVTTAWAIGGVILLSSTFLYRVLGQRGLVAMERLMGMLLVMVAVQMLMNGISTFLHRQ